MNFFTYFFRREELARSHIAESIAAHTRYEWEHSERQGTRLVGKGPSHELTLNPKRHGLYDRLQARMAVFQRVTRAYHHAGRKPPKKLWDWIGEALNADS